MLFTINSRHYDRSFTPSNPLNLISSLTGRALKPRSALVAQAFLLTVVASCLPGVHASPLHARAQLAKRETPVTIWVPVVVIVLVLFFLAVLLCTRTTLWPKIKQAFAPRSSAPAQATQNGPRELTAEQLAGTINGDAGAPNNGTRRARRPRRHRRTPSQMSVTSLPEYAKEAGEEEVVIFRGHDAEDASTMPAAVVMDPVDEEREDDNSQRSERYSAVPSPPNDQPLLQDEESDIAAQGIHSPTADTTRRSVESGSLEGGSLSRIDSIPPDMRGPSPAYFEVTDGGGATNTANALSSSPPSSPDSPATRRSGFRTLLNRMSMHGHQRGDSNASGMSRAGPGHRPTNSTSSSFLSSPMFRTLSRQKSNHTLNSTRLNSPSMISLNSISSPLTHTAVRTEFTYPKTGPTAEQLKVIASRESIARFGMPYGPDAIAFASNSRLDLLTPPPDFEATAASSSAEPQSAPPSASSAAGPSRLRTMSSAADTRAPETTLSATLASPPIIEGLPTSSSTPPPTSSPDSSIEAPAASTHPGLPSSISKAHNPESVHPSTQEPSPPLAPPTTSPAPVLPAPAPASGHGVSEFGQKLSVVPPPSSFSFHDPSGNTARSESVMSMYSYATAAESLSPSTSRSRSFADAESEAESSEAEEPSTPRLGATRGHELEPTDATVTPANANLGASGGQ